MRVAGTLVQYSGEEEGEEEEEKGRMRVEEKYEFPTMRGGDQISLTFNSACMRVLTVLVSAAFEKCHKLYMMNCIF